MTDTQKKGLTIGVSGGVLAVIGIVVAVTGGDFSWLGDVIEIIKTALGF